MQWVAEDDEMVFATSRRFTAIDRLISTKN